MQVSVVGIYIYIYIVLMAGTHLLSILYNILQKFAQFL